MRKLLLGALALATATGCISAQNVTVKGKLGGYKGDMVLSSVGRTIDTLNVAADGTFELKAQLAEPTQVAVLVRDDQTPTIEFLAAPGDQIAFTLSRVPGQDVQVVFTGPNAALNNFLTEYSIKTDYSRSSMEDVAKLSFATHAANIDRMMDGLQAYLDKVEDSDDKTALQDQLDLTRRQRKFTYAWAINRVGGRPVDADPDFVKFAQSLDMNDRRVIGEPYGMVTHRGMLDQRLRWEIERNPELYPGANSSLRMFAAIPRFVSDQDVVNTLAENQIDGYFSQGGDENLAATFEAYKKLSTDEKAIAKLEKQFRELDELGPGKMAPDFALTDPDGKRCMLSDLRGKVLYIDVWATWCGPCVGEIPFVEKLYEKYKGNPNLEFVSISVDDSIDAWKKKLEADKPGWKNFVVDGGFRGPMNELYYISGIPRFMLIDKDGKIITVNAPRPSSENIEEVLGKYM